MPISILVVQNPLKVKELVRVHYGQLCGCDGTEYIPALEAGFYEFKSRRPYLPLMLRVRLVEEAVLKIVGGKTLWGSIP